MATFIIVIILYCVARSSQVPIRDDRTRDLHFMRGDNNGSEDFPPREVIDSHRPSDIFGHLNIPGNENTEEYIMIRKAAKAIVRRLSLPSPPKLQILVDRAAHYVLKNNLESEYAKVKSGIHELVTMYLNSEKVKPIHPSPTARQNILPHEPQREEKTEDVIAVLEDMLEEIAFRFNLTTRQSKQMIHASVKVLSGELNLTPHQRKGLSERVTSHVRARLELEDEDNRDARLRRLEELVEGDMEKYHLSALKLRRLEALKVEEEAIKENLSKAEKMRMLKRMYTDVVNDLQEQVKEAKPQSRPVFSKQSVSAILQALNSKAAIRKLTDHEVLVLKKVIIAALIEIGNLTDLTHSTKEPVANLTSSSHAATTAVPSTPSISSHVTAHTNLVTTRGEHVTTRGEHVTTHGEHVTMRGEQVTKHGEYVTTRGDHVTMRGEQVTKHGEYVTTRGDHVTMRGEHPTTPASSVTTEDKYLLQMLAVGEQGLANRGTVPQSTLITTPIPSQNYTAPVPPNHEEQAAATGEEVMQLRFTKLPEHMTKTDELMNGQSTKAVELPTERVTDRPEHTTGSLSVAEHETSSLMRSTMAPELSTERLSTPEHSTLMPENTPNLSKPITEMLTKPDESTGPTVRLSMSNKHKEAHKTETHELPTDSEKEENVFPTVAFAQHAQDEELDRQLNVNNQINAKNNDEKDLEKELEIAQELQIELKSDRNKRLSHSKKRVLKTMANREQPGLENDLFNAVQSNQNLESTLRDVTGHGDITRGQDNSSFGMTPDRDSSQNGVTGHRYNSRLNEERLLEYELHSVVPNKMPDRGSFLRDMEGGRDASRRDTA
ncbi:uncharacterized protein LOC116613997 [Nematostella vectensis]|uniref:uncharacterized protein LOC116613997 n=1 Tax=Nematostella vectensis TaxID=45351 RepID=UPI0020773D38|nr:uncharacterized protein LOC116613997 [Nematostella vectensis]